MSVTAKPSLQLTVEVRAVGGGQVLLDFSFVGHVKDLGFQVMHLGKLTEEA